ncbi:MAG: TonB family protein, partial [Thermoanaerobaculia bacterium]
ATRTPTNTRTPTATPTATIRTTPTITPLRSIVRRTPAPAATPTSSEPEPGTYVHSDDVDRPPRIRQAVNPVYPPDALRARIRGLVILAVLISESGTPLEVRVIQRARAGLTEAAVEAVRRWRFEPAQKSGVPVTTWTTVRIPFEAIPYPTETPAREFAPPATPTPPPVARATAPPPIRPSPSREADAVVRTQRAIRLAVTPEQARVYVNGAYVGIADDWDGRGGGLDYEFSNRGGNFVRLELPGYRTIELEVVVTSGADDEVLEIHEELERQERRPYSPLPAIAARASNGVAFDVQPPDAVVSVGGRILGVARHFHVESPLRLNGPAAYDLLFSAPGHTSRVMRVLIAPQAEEQVARLTVRLRRQGT